MYAKDTQFSDWLCWYTNKDRENMAQPFPLDDGKRAATNGTIAVVTSEEGSSSPCHKPPIVDVADVGPCEHPARDVCPKCCGTKEVDHECDCSLCEAEFEDCKECDGTGWIETIPETRYVTIWGELFNANLVAYVLEHAPQDHQYTLRLVKCGENPTLHIVAAKWHAIVVAMTKSVKAEHACSELATRWEQDEAVAIKNCEATR